MEPLFYQQHLNRVSRSFAFCIEELSSPFREWVALSYILFRVLDTVEDSPWEDWKQQEKHFLELQRFLEAPAQASEISGWVSLFPQTIPEGEQLLLKDVSVFFRDFHALEPSVREPIRRSVEKMNRGMEHFSKTRERGVLRLKNLKEVNQYCFCVAGLVGELLSDLYRVYRPGFKVPSDFYENSYRFGLFLQKVNLLKDQLTDEPEGRFLIHDRPEVIGSLRAEAEGALGYIASLPDDEKGFRTFCAWSMFLGLASIPFMEEAYQTRSAVKISREMTKALLSEVSAVIRDNSALRELFQDAISVLPDEGPLREFGQESHSDQWFIELASSSELGLSLMKKLGFLS